MLALGGQSRVRGDESERCYYVVMFWWVRDGGELTG